MLTLNYSQNVVYITEEDGRLDVEIQLSDDTLDTINFSFEADDRATAMRELERLFPPLIRATVSIAAHRRDSAEIPNPEDILHVRMFNMWHRNSLNPPLDEIEPRFAD